MDQAEYNWPQNIVRKMKSGCQTLFEWLRLRPAGSTWASALLANKSLTRLSSRAGQFYYTGIILKTIPL